MILPIDLIVLVFLIVSAVAAITVKDLLSAAVILGAYSFLACLLWTVMGAVDVAFTEATVGAGVSTVFCVSAIFHTTRRTKD
ncbi:MAG: Na(+)/H(+) antiporter subunit B [Desulfamplus sp.]